MAKFIGFSNTQQQTVNKVYRTARVALESAATDLGGTKYRQVFAQVMGGGTVSSIKKAEGMLDKSIKAMFNRVATLSFTVAFVNLGAGTNAEMLHPTGQTLDNVQDKLDEYLASSSPVIGAMPMKLGAPFFAMPFTSLTEQSQVQTFLHELSHHAAATIDDQNGGECYGQTGVTRLKGLGPERAVRNAENVGWFLVRYA